MSNSFRGCIGMIIWIIGVSILAIGLVGLFSSCNATLEGYRQYDPNNGVIEYRYNPSWGHYRHFYYRPVPYNDRWIYRDYYWNNQPPLWQFNFNRNIVKPRPNKQVKSTARRGQPKPNHRSSSNQNRGRRQ